MKNVKSSLLALIILLSGLSWGTSSVFSSEENSPEDDLIFSDGLEAPPVLAIASFGASPEIITEGESIVISWATELASVCVPSDGSGGWGSLEIHLPAGSVEISISSPGIYLFTLSCSAEGFSPVIQDISVVVEALVEMDTDGDRLSDSVEINIGTNPFRQDTDGDGIKDGDEVLGTEAGLDLPGMGTSPLRQDILIEYDWFDDDIGCGVHSHKPSNVSVNSVSLAFANSPVVNPDGSSGINVIHDYGQGGLFTGGSLVNDDDGVIAGGIRGGDFLSYKAANFASNRKGYFRYVLMPHRYNTDSDSSGQAELPGDDMIVSLVCFHNDKNAANTIMHELGHNLRLHHGGNEACNYKPNYNSVMNYAYQFPGVDDSCDQFGDGVLDYSDGSRIDLNESDLDENEGVCVPGSELDWNENDVIEDSIELNINQYKDEANSNHCGSELSVLTDYNDWANLDFGGVSAVGGGASRITPELIDEQPVPKEYSNDSSKLEN